MTRLDRLKKIADGLELQLKDDTIRHQKRIDLEVRYNGILEDILDELKIENK